jgi:hypothetical protein
MRSQQNCGFDFNDLITKAENLLSHLKPFFFDSEKLTTFAVWRLINSAGFLFVYISAFLDFHKFCFFLPFVCFILFAVFLLAFAYLKRHKKTRQIFIRIYIAQQ